MVVGSERVFDHTTFPELRWVRDPFAPSMFTAHTGFTARGLVLSDEFKEIIKDLHALQRVRDVYEISRADAVMIHQIDNRQASIESRLFECMARRGPSSLLQECCILAAYLCTYNLYTEIWQGSVIPSHCSEKLLRKLRELADEASWVGYEALRIWFVMIGALFCPPYVSIEYRVLLRTALERQSSPGTKSWTGVRCLLRNFIWSDRVFDSRGQTVC